MALHLFQVFHNPLLSFDWTLFGQLLLGFGKDALEANYQQITHQTDEDLPGFLPQVLLPEVTDWVSVCVALCHTITADNVADCHTANTNVG
jgi:hypothetical protein